MAKAPPTRTRPGDSSVSPVEDRLAQLTAQFDLLKAQVRQAQQLANLGTAAAMLAHEVNNLLTPICGYAEYALTSDDHELMRKALIVTNKNAHMVIAMSSRILEISAARPQKTEPVAVRAVVEDALASLCRDLSKDGINLAVNVDESLMVQADSLQLQQVLFNLFLNAREAMSATHSGRLTISASRSADHVVIEVRNMGDPIPVDLLSHLFEPFQTSKPVERDGRRRCGGLGLALCRDLIEENSGTIQVASDAERGTVFTITLPASPAG
jgi:two-component system NtrC family sensor kinase